MAIIIPPGFALIDLAFRHSAYQRDAHVTYGVDTAGAPTLVAEAVATIWLTEMNGLLDSTVTMREVQATIGQDGGEPLVEFFLNTTTGQRASESTPPALAMLVTKRTGLGGRRNTGRMFLPWFNSDNGVSEVGILPASEVATRQAAASAWLDGHETVGAPMVLLHRTGISPAPPPTPITQLVVSNVISTQRRRQVRNI